MARSALLPSGVPEAPIHSASIGRSAASPTWMCAAPVLYGVPPCSGARRLPDFSALAGSRRQTARTPAQTARGAQHAPTTGGDVRNESRATRDDDVVIDDEQVVRRVTSDQLGGAPAPCANPHAWYPHRRAAVCSSEEWSRGTWRLHIARRHARTTQVAITIKVKSGRTSSRPAKALRHPHGSAPRIEPCPGAMLKASLQGRKPSSPCPPAPAYRRPCRAPGGRTGERPKMMQRGGINECTLASPEARKRRRHKIPRGGTGRSMRQARSKDDMLVGARCGNLDGSIAEEVAPLHAFFRCRIVVVSWEVSRSAR